ncbi:HAMP domain-containing protein [Betaproteobacteria bacterium PRO7]|jgi:nitrogen fixation/metabolism regulation signal transduction histidine kinase|nr:HAMP domain-containing protein [Betaproteobacteria bacterium PRO7]GIL06078.1 MAG: two-component sensor histidine kinase [Betaproteobacteria bacterium]
MAAASRVLRYGLLGALALGGVLLFLLASASSNTQAFERNYPVLLAINGVIAAILFVLVLALIARLVRRWRQGRFGARLMTRFAVAFALMGVLPGVLIYVVSVQFLSRSIESWFDVRVDRALESGLTLGRAVLEAQLADVTAKARAIALELADVPESQQLQALDRLRERAGIHEALIVTAGGQLIGASGARSADLVPEIPTAANLRQARIQRSFAVIEGDPLATEPRAGLRTRVIVPIPAASAPAAALSPGSSPGLRSPLAAGSPPLRPAPPVRVEPRYLQLLQRVPPSVAANAEALQSGYRDYQELSLARSGLRKIYTVTLTLTLLLAVFAAMASGVLLASSMTAPLLQVAEGTKAVAEGDFRPVREYKGSDELNLLTQSFNAMTRQLSEARDAVEARSRELENARAYLERVLTNLSAGVVVLDKDYRLVTANHGASRILGLALTPHVGEPFAALVPAMAEQVAGAFADQQLSASPKDSWQQQMQVPRAGAAAGAEPLALLARGSRLPLDDGPGYVVVFDDITQVISAQRALAWGEVARRLAHEIKNPLTPIQLAAERLQMKLAGALPPERADVLARGVATIVSQVAAMKRMVDDFRDYARVPPAKLAPLDLNALIEEVAALYGVEHGRGASPTGAQIELALGADVPPIEGDATQLRQVIHNLIANALDALAAPGQTGGGRIVLRTALVSLPERRGERGADDTRAASAVRLSVEDNGPGFPANILRRAFEPYVTTKPSGTGLGLAMVKKIVDEHGARVELVNRTTGSAGGATVIIVFRRLAQATPASSAASGAAVH